MFSHGYKKSGTSTHPKHQSCADHNPTKDNSAADRSPDSSPDGPNPDEGHSPNDNTFTNLDTNEPQPPTRHKRPALGIAIIVTAIAGLILCAVFDRLGSALFFVGIPCLLAAGIGVINAKTSYGRVMQITTIVLLLMSALLHEAAFCLLLAAPVVYLAAAGGLWVSKKWGGQKTSHAVAIPLIVLCALEGVAPHLRVGQLQETQATSTYTQSCDNLTERLMQGPKAVGASRYGLLNIAPYPTPRLMKLQDAGQSGSDKSGAGQSGSKGSDAGAGFVVGQKWQTSIGPGVLSSRVVGVSRRSVSFEVLADESKASRWVDLQSARLVWQPVAAGCELTVSVVYARKLDPGWWFGPITHVFTGHATKTLAESLVASEAKAGK